MNTKMSTLAAAAVALERDDIQICYVEPNRYNYYSYSVAGTDFYIFSVPGVPVMSLVDK